MSHRASEVLNRTLAQKPSAKADVLDANRKFSFNEVENDVSIDCKAASDTECESVTSSLAVSSLACNALGEGIDALRSLSTNQDSSRCHATTPPKPWKIATSLATSPEKMAHPPATASMSAF